MTFSVQVVVVDVPPHRRGARRVAAGERESTARCCASHAQSSGSVTVGLPVTGEVVAGNGNVPLTLIWIRPGRNASFRSGPHQIGLKIAVAGRIAEVRTCGLGDDRGLILHPDHEELVLISRVPREQQRDERLLTAA